MNHLPNLVALLKSRGFVFDSLRGSDATWAMGGTSLREADVGIFLFEDPFIVEQYPDGWMIRTEGGGQLVREQLAGDLTEVANLISARFCDRLKPNPCT